jgi:hypothetical protein
MSPGLRGETWNFWRPHKQYQTFKSYCTGNTLRLDCTDGAVCSENHRKRVNIMCGQWKAEILKCWRMSHTQFPEYVKKNKSMICQCSTAKDNKMKFIHSFLVNKTNRCTESQFYWYYYSRRFWQPFWPSAGVLSLTSALLPGAGWNCSSILLLVANGHQKLHNCTNADVRLRTSDDGQKGCPKHVDY